MFENQVDISNIDAIQLKYLQFSSVQYNLGVYTSLDMVYTKDSIVTYIW